MTFLDLPVILPQIKAGNLKPIALGARERAKQAPDVPTTAEVGMPDLLIENWYGMVGPAGLPREILDKINRVAVEAMSDPSVREKLGDQGLTLVPQKPEEFRAFIAADAIRWAKVIKDAGIETTK
jgi:tripartite-type tricarboxylate transporter receptor subunit TctC